jgi:leucyl aminopeptidase
LKVADAAQAVVEGTILGLYRYAAPRGNLDETALHSVESFTLIEFDQSRLPEVEAGARIGHIVAGAACVARDLDNQPSNVMTPTALADVAQAIAADFGMACEVMGAEQMGELKMGALLGVSRGASQPPRFIVLEHNPGVDAGAGPFVLVGKGITFDSGGISIKPSSGMEQMRGDMSGAAAALASMQAIGAIGLRGHVVALVPATENMPGGNAIHPGDVVTAMNGLSIEVVDTDAEGRLVLADALAYAQRYRPAFVVDIATLTGAIATALGHHMTGVYANEDALWSAIQTAGEAAGELMWRMPLDPVFDVQIETPFADVKNYGGSPGGSATGASFLAKFIGDHAWAHLDIGSTDWWEADQVYTKKPYFVRGCTGVGVGTLVGLLRAWEAGHLSRHR